MTRIFKSLLVFAAFSLVTGCLQHEEFVPEEPNMSGLLQTKAVNTSDDAHQGSLLLLLDEKLAAVLNEDASEADFDAVCQELGVTKIERVFPLADDDLARNHRLHRWFKVYFPESSSLVATAEKFAMLSSVNAIEYNTRLNRNETGSVHAWEPFPTGNYGEFNLPFNDPMLQDQWHYINNADFSICSTVRAGADVGVENAWRLTGGDPRIIVAICDEGVKYTHPDLAPNMWVNEDEIPDNGIDDDGNGYIDDVHGYNFLNPVDMDPDGLLEISWAKEGDNGHGTHVAGTVAAVNNNGKGVCGVAGGTGNGDGVRLMSCQLFSGNSTATVDGRARSYKYAADNGASVLQCSFGVTAGMYTSDQAYEQIYGVEWDALNYFMSKPNCDAVDKNIVIYASGNDAKPLAGYPAAYHDYISVSAIGPDYLPTTYTNYGPGCNISAPGGDISLNTLSTGYRAQILSTVPDEMIAFDNEAYGYMQGTSMACPHVSGVVSLGLSYALALGKSYTYDEFLAMIYSSVNDLEYYMETSVRLSYGIEFDITPMRGGMGTGSIDAWRLLMQVEGVPSVTVKKGEAWKVSLEEYFGGSSANLTYTSVKVDDVSRELLGIEGDPYIKNGKLFIKCNRTGSAKISITAIAGGDQIGGGAVVGGTEFTKVISILSRDVASKNGGWL